MLNTKIQPQNLSGFWRRKNLFLQQMGMAAILFNGPEPFNKLSKPFDRRLRVKSSEIGKAVSEKKTFKDYRIWYKYIAEGQG